MKYSLFSENPLVSKADFQQLVKDLFEPLIPYYQTQGSRIDFDEGGACFDMVAASLEGVARPLWGLVPLEIGGGNFEHWGLVRKLIIQGTDPNSDGYWGLLHDVDQRSVEMAAIGFFVALLPQQAWEPLSTTEKENLVLWLSSIQDKETSHNNWLFFTLIVQQALKTVGRSDLVDLKMEQKFLEKLKSWYLGDGWYGDGDIETVDHYGGFALHYYGLIYAKKFKYKNDDFSSIFKSRADAFAIPFSYWFADNGDTLVQGRSLTYRFACCGFWAAYSISDNTVFSPGQIKGLWARHLRSWKHKPIFTYDGILTRGYDYPNLQMCEVYNSPTSPYWAMKAFLPLMLADDSIFWSSEEQAIEYPAVVQPMPANKTIVQRIDGNSIVHYGAAIHPGFQLDKYNKFAYSTFGGMDVSALLYAEKLSFGDNILAFSFDGGCNWQMRQKNIEVNVDQSRLNITWTSGKVTVTTTIDVYDSGECVRTHRFDSSEDLWVVESGFVVGKWYQEELILNSSTTDGSEIIIQGSNGISAIKSLDNHLKSAHVTTRVNSDVSFPRSAVPFLLTKLESGNHTISSQFKMCK
ncbi:DUF2264 domain-containing protein [Vibrio sp. DW001]|uniref:DUF2264 domain-containing protein n=1 Tax=Vibrio sp. DW001 TaxID=2912315 RepID=UPI0023B1354D|nr:DUF2264 domain-containing protein [Vibrio sp. DW001]WED29773.1 DUF2264 domain-containing protein [Vibrio sp. DW001]